MEHKGLTPKSLITLADCMELLNEVNAPEHEKAAAFFLLTDIKQTLIDREMFEEVADFKYLEEAYNIDIPFNA
jgi:hypothetical protein